jgi:hypothetical protein
MDFLQSSLHYLSSILEIEGKELGYGYPKARASSLLVLLEI